MHYKTIIHQLLLARPQMHECLRKERKLLTTLETLARELRESHQAWKELLAGNHPGSDPSQIASQAMEMALKDLEDRLPPELPQDEVFSLDEAMAYLQRPTSRG